MNFCSYYEANYGTDHNDTLTTYIHDNRRKQCAAHVHYCIGITIIIAFVFLEELNSCSFNHVPSTWCVRLSSSSVALADGRMDYSIYGFMDGFMDD
jgi:hypothetical protein